MREINPWLVQLMHKLRPRQDTRTKCQDVAVDSPINMGKACSFPLFQTVAPTITISVTTPTTNARNSGTLPGPL